MAGEAGPMRPGPSRFHKPRELRRRVLLAARVRTPAGWGDACILNVSSRGMLIHAGRTPVGEGSTIELRHQELAIVARVVWRDGARVGLTANERLPVEQIMSLGQSPALQLTATVACGAERRRQPRTHEDSRLRGRVFEFAGIAFIAVILSGGLFVMVEEALARPIAYVEAALRR
jgi:hypothetical protein